MNIKSLNTLKLNKDGSYNLYLEVLNNNPINLISFICEKRHEMRIDNVCFDIYEKVDYIDVICNINGLINIFDIKENDILYYIEEEDISNIISDDTLLENIKEILSKANKSKDFKLDKNRINDTNNRKNIEKNKKYLPPNILPENAKNISFENGKIIIKTNL
jgi:hypothetical protein